MYDKLNELSLLLENVKMSEDDCNEGSLDDETYSQICDIIQSLKLSCLMISSAYVLCGKKI